MINNIFLGIVKSICLFTLIVCFKLGLEAYSKISFKYISTFSIFTSFITLKQILFFNLLAQ